MIEVGDRVTYKYNNSNNIETVIVTLDELIDEYKTMIEENSITILKIERPKWEVVEEKKELLTEEERQFLKKIIESYNQMFKRKICKIHYYSEEKLVLMNEIKEYEIEIENSFREIDIGAYYTLEELRIGGIRWKKI